MAQATLDAPATDKGPSFSDMVLFWASFLALVAAGIGFSVRTSILANWAELYGFTQTDLGSITGSGLIGFCLPIIALSLVADRIGYGPLMAIAFLLHLAAATITLFADACFKSYGQYGAYQCLYFGMLFYSFGNGTVEAVINPLTATLFPRNRTHWLNILHAGWPAGLLIGGILSYFFQEAKIPWEYLWLTFLLPVLLYGIMMIGRKFPRSEASTSGVSLGVMLLQFTSPILLFLLVLHAMVGYVELGTDSWITNINDKILQEVKRGGLYMFMWTSALMLVLRFFAGPIVHRISPLGLLFVSGILGCIGLLLLGTASGVAMCFIAATIYALGKTFLWPTMLGVVSERFPKGGAVTLGVAGGIGMLSAGFLGGPVIGYKQDYVASETLKTKAPETYARYKAKEEQSPLAILPKVAGLDGAKVAVVLDNAKKLNDDLEALEKRNSKDENLNKLNTWWQSEGKPHYETDKPLVEEAGLTGGRMALIYTAAVPAAMALGYLLLILYFRLTGGYKQVHLDGSH
jgi:MFS family permease